MMLSGQPRFGCMAHAFQSKRMPDSLHVVSLTYDMAGDTLPGRGRYASRMADWSVCLGTCSGTSDRSKEYAVTRWQDGSGPGGHPPDTCTIHWVSSYADLAKHLTSGWET